MANSAIYTVQYRRKREGKTHYKKRLELLKSDRTRLVIRKSNTNTIIQFVSYEADGDKVLVTFNSKNLESYGWKYSKSSLPAAYLAGLVAGTKLKEHKVTEAILDLGLQTPIKGSKLYAAVKGVIDAGVNVPSSDDIFPSEERIKGEHIANAGEVSKSFTNYQKQKLDVAKLPEVFESVKQKIIGGK